MNALDGLRAAMAATDAYYKERGIFQGKFGFGECPALVVIDMAYGWTDPAYAGGSARLDAAVDAIARLLPAARAQDVPVFYTTGIDRPQLITGCSTSACVRATATDAKSYQLRPIIVREAVQDRSEIAHEWTLFDVQARFADVVSLDE